MDNTKTLRRAFMPEGEVGVYHVMSRAAFGLSVLNDRGKEVFVGMMWRQAAFSGVEILTYCIMENHFHMLVRVPEGFVDLLDDQELARRYRALYGHCQEMHPGQLHPDDLDRILRDDGDRAAGLRLLLKRRMGNLSCFVQELKLRYARWYNHTHNNRGSIWSGRYKSVMVEPKGASVETLAVYIDLNPVRAGLVDDPAKYRWSGYGEAVAGSAIAREGLESVFVQQEGLDTMARYRQRLGVIARFCTVSDKSKMSRAVFEKIRQADGQFSEVELLSLKVRYFLDGCILGSEAFLTKQRDRLMPSRSRQRLGIPLCNGVYSLRRLQKGALG